jgi:hypothetical protein
MKQQATIAVPVHKISLNFSTVFLYHTISPLVLASHGCASSTQRLSHPWLPAPSSTLLHPGLPPLQHCPNSTSLILCDPSPAIPWLLPLPSHGQRGSTPPLSSCNEHVPSPMRLGLSRQSHLVSGPNPLLNPAYRWGCILCKN